MKVSKLGINATNYAVAKALGYLDQKIKIGSLGECFRVVIDEDGKCFDMIYGVEFSPATNYNQGSPIIDKEKIEVRWIITDADGGGYWQASNIFTDVHCITSTSSHLIAAMKCFVIGKIGVNIDIPEDVL